MKSYKSELREFIEIFEYCQEIIELIDDNSDPCSIEWERAYDKIFSQDVSKRALSIYRFDWYDPDTTYKDDLMHFMWGFEEAVDEVKNKLNDYEKN